MKIEVAKCATHAKTPAWGPKVTPVFYWEEVAIPSAPRSLGGFIEEVLAVVVPPSVLCVRATWGDTEWTLYNHPTWGLVPDLALNEDESNVIETWPSIEDLGGPWIATHVLPDGHGLPLCYVPPAENFQMGDRDSHQREVEVGGGFVALTPTTVEQWGWFCASKGKDPRAELTGTVADHPVVRVNFWESKAFSEWAGLVLPTEEQWERAARGDDGRVYPWGNKEPGPAPDPRCHWSGGGGNGVNGPDGVFNRPDGASPYGILDMSGGVWEWCDSVYYR